MRGSPARGALLGTCIGIFIVAVLILLPAAVQGDFYEIGDPLLIIGVPIVVLSALVGALVVNPGGADADGVAQTSARARQVWIVCLSVGAFLAVWLLLWGTGVVAAPPLGIG